MISSFDDVVSLLMKHGATKTQAQTIIIGIRKVPLSTKNGAERSYQMAKWAIEKAKEYGRQNAATTVGHRE